MSRRRLEKEMNFDSEWYERRSGRKPSRPDDPRAPYDHDLARVIHSASFRRLQSKTQVLGLGESDFYRTRLTHSIEVAQIATGIKRWLEEGKNVCDGTEHLPTVPQLTAISLAHDIGHPPFGHGGEVALNYMMRGSGGFEGNAQTLRILASLEYKTEKDGLDLTRRTMLGVLKYPVRFSEGVNEFQSKGICVDDCKSHRSVQAEIWKPPKCYYDADEPLVQWILEPLSSSDKKLFQSSISSGDGKHRESEYKSFDTTLMDISDDISYAVHDLEDAIHMKFLKDNREDRELVREAISVADPGWLSEFELDNAVDELFGEKWRRKEAISRLVHCLICSTSIEMDTSFEEPLLKYRISLSSEADKLASSLQALVFQKVIRSPEVQTLEYSGQQLVMELFEAMESSPQRLLPSDTQMTLGNKTGEDLSRVVCDHISGMTDDYAARIYGRLFMPNSGSLFQKM